MADSLDTLPNDEFRDRWRTWLHANYPDEWRIPIVHRLAGDDERRWHRMTLAAGWRAPAWPKEYGGLGLGLEKQLIMHQEMEAHSCARVLDSGGVLFAPVLMKYGTDEQKARYLPAILSGDDLWCQGYSEPNAGSDLASLRTSAVRDGDDFIVNGQKIWTTLAVPADRIFVLVRTNRDVKKQAGISFLLVDMDTPGLTVRPMMNLAGEDELCEVFFENVRVPAANLVGEVDQGWTVAKALLGDERIANGAPTLSRQAFTMLEQVIEGLELTGDQGVADRQAQLLCDIHDLAALHGQVADAAIRGEVDHAVLGLMKVLATDLFQKVTDELLRVSGDHAALMEPVGVGGLSMDLRRLFMVARPSTIYAGANEVQRNVAANMLMGPVARQA
ncbi:acyl-CoA dehydrogenase [Rhizobium sp. CRIBSB]|nr:acyl-CoA dehydrogenase [Rhizobium sp. CRIBSB]